MQQLNWIVLNLSFVIRVYTAGPAVYTRMTNDKFVLGDNIELQ